MRETRLPGRGPPCASRSAGRRAYACLVLAYLELSAGGGRRPALPAVGPVAAATSSHGGRPHPPSRSPPAPGRHPHRMAGTFINGADPPSLPPSAAPPASRAVASARRWRPPRRAGRRGARRPARGGRAPRRPAPARSPRRARQALRRCVGRPRGAACRDVLDAAPAASPPTPAVRCARMALGRRWRPPRPIPVCDAVVHRGRWAWRRGWGEVGRRLPELSSLVILFLPCLLFFSLWRPVLFACRPLIVRSPRPGLRIRGGWAGWESAVQQRVLETEFHSE